MKAKKFVLIYNGNRTEWGPIRSVIIRVINKIGRPLLIKTIIVCNRRGSNELPKTFDVSIFRGLGG